MTRRTLADATREAVIAERAGALDLAGARCRAVDRLLERRKMTAEEAGWTKRAIRNFADDLAIGLHRDGNDPAGVRDAMRALTTGVERPKGGAA